MSFPKIGSVTTPGPSGEKDTRFTHSRTVSQAEASEPAIVTASSTATMPRARPASGMRSGRSSASKAKRSLS